MPGHREETLVHELAVSQMLQHFERVYSEIWASQVAILRHLNAAAEMSDTTENLRGYYDAVAAQYPDVFGKYPFDDYLGYLEGALLTTRVGDRVTLTEEGRLFLEFLTTSRKPEKLLG